MPDPTPVVPLPSPDTGKGGLVGWLLSHVRPFLNSLPGFVSSAELDKIAHVAIAAGSLCGAVAAVLVELTPSLKAWAGPSFGPLVGALATLLAGYFGARARATDSTDSEGNHAAAAIVPERDNRLRPFDPGGHGAA